MEIRQSLSAVASSAKFVLKQVGFMFRLLISFLFFQIVFIPQAFAHQGRLDVNGGHYDHQTGRYDCHRLGCVDKAGKNIAQAGNLFAQSTIKKYNRRNWPHWIDEDNDCQNTRAEILIRDSLKPVRFKRNKNCAVVEGKWIDPYTGQIMFKASRVDIDHVVPLEYAWQTGAADWPKSRKQIFANDFHNLLAVNRSVNRSKSNKGPSRWQPPLRNYWCEYASLWRQIQGKYNLLISAGEDQSLRKMERACGG